MANEFNNNPKQFPNRAAEQVANTAGAAMKEGEQKIGELKDQFGKQIQQGQEQLSRFAAIADKQVRENPWPVVAGVAVLSFIAGCVMTSCRNRE